MTIQQEHFKDSVKGDHVKFYSLYNGEIELEFNSKQHRYYLHSKSIPSVTGITGVSGKEQLIAWAARMAVEHVADRLKPGVPLDEAEIEELLDGALRAHRRKKEKAATIGTIVHEWIERYIYFKIDRKNVDMDYPVNEQARNSVFSFLKWEKENNVLWHCTEKKIFSKEYGYAGTLDNKATVNGNKCIGDIKTGSGIWKESYYQLAAYRHAETEEFKEDYPGSFILHVPKDGGDVVPYPMYGDIYQTAWQGFLGCWDVYKSNKIIEKRLKEIWLKNNP